jgi:hypothetical protein
VPASDIFYDPGTGQLIAGSLMDYALPRADDLPSYDLGFNGTRCTTNPLGVKGGVKGGGKAGAVGAFPAVTNAVLDALAPLDVADLVGPGPRSASGGRSEPVPWCFPDRAQIADSIPCWADRASLLGDKVSLFDKPGNIGRKSLIRRNDRCAIRRP